MRPANLSKNDRFLHTSRERVDGIDKFKSQGLLTSWWRGRALNPCEEARRTSADHPYPAKLALPIRVLAAHINVDKRPILANAALEKAFLA